MANNNIGECKCPFTGKLAYVRRAARGKYPLYLASKSIGIVFLKTPDGQEWVEKNATFYQTIEPGGRVKVERVESEQVEAEPKPAPQKPAQAEPGAKRGGWNLEDLE